jgi:putative oxidoreductase
LIVHGWGKVLRGPVGQGALLARDGGPFGVKMAIFLIFVEFVGGIYIAFGLFTRFFAAAVAIEMGYLTFIQYWANGFSWLNRGYEYVLLWGLVSLAVALRGLVLARSCGSCRQMVRKTRRTGVDSAAGVFFG